MIAAMPAQILFIKNWLIPKLANLIETDFITSPIKKAARASLSSPPNKKTKQKAPKAEINIAVLSLYLSPVSINFNCSLSSETVSPLFTIFLDRSLTLCTLSKSIVRVDTLLIKE